MMGVSRTEYCSSKAGAARLRLGSNVNIVHFSTPAWQCLSNVEAGPLSKRIRCRSPPPIRLAATFLANNCSNPIAYRVDNEISHRRALRD